MTSVSLSPLHIRYASPSQVLCFFCCGFRQLTYQYDGAPALVFAARPCMEMTGDGGLSLEEDGVGARCSDVAGGRLKEGALNPFSFLGRMGTNGFAAVPEFLIGVELEPSPRPETLPEKHLPDM